MCWRTLVRGVATLVCGVAPLLVGLCLTPVIVGSQREGQTFTTPGGSDTILMPSETTFL